MTPMCTAKGCRLIWRWVMNRRWLWALLGATLLGGVALTIATRMAMRDFPDDLDSLTGATVTGPSPSPATLTVDLGATNPNPGDVVNFTLPSVPEGKDWMALVDTNQPEKQLASFPFGHVYAVTGRSMVAFGLSAEDSTTRRLRQGMGSILEVMETPLSD